MVTDTVAQLAAAVGASLTPPTETDGEAPLAFHLEASGRVVIIYAARVLVLFEPRIDVNVADVEEYSDLRRSVLGMLALAAGGRVRAGVTYVPDRAGERFVEFGR